MGAQWKHAGRIAASSKKGVLIGKLVKEIIVAAKTGDPNPENNSRLRAAVESARKASVPRDTIERAIKKGSGQLDDGVTFEKISYEGFAPHRVPLIVDCLTDNKNRTAADLRVLFRKGQLGAVGSVAWMFDRLGVLEATLPQVGVDIEGVAIEAGAQNVEPLEGVEPSSGQTGARFFCEPSDLDVVSKALTQQGWTLTLAELSFVPKQFPDLNAEQLKEVTEFLQAIDDHDDVHRVYAAMK